MHLCMIYQADPGELALRHELKAAHNDCFPKRFLARQNLEENYNSPELPVPLSSPLPITVKPLTFEF